MSSFGTSTFTKTLSFALLLALIVSVSTSRAADDDEDPFKEATKRMAEQRKQMDRLFRELGVPRVVFPDIEMGGGFGPLMGEVRANNNTDARLGAKLRIPSATLVDQLDLPKDQGMVIEEVGPNSPAAKAGLKANDILLELAGKSVLSKPEEFTKLVAGIKAETPIEAVVLRKGRKETIKGLSLPEAKAVVKEAPNPGFGGVLGGGGFGLGGNGTSFTRTNDQFTINHREGDLKLIIKGPVTGGTAKVDSITIEDKDGKKTYEDVEKVPAEHQEKVKKLTKMASRGVIRVPF
jgi:membrane-associated protease RseP (regulator of RpoE activity)